MSGALAPRDLHQFSVAGRAACERAIQWASPEFLYVSAAGIGENVFAVEVWTATQQEHP
jgi:hypothetical protein